jgi:hypothetical protein
VFPVRSPNKNTKHGIALAKISKTQKFRFQESKNKVVLVTFSNSHKEFVAPGQTVNKNCCVEILFRVIQRIRRVKTSVSGERKSAPFALQSQTSHCNISKAVFSKTRNSRIKSPHILLIYPHHTFSCSPN